MKIPVFRIFLESDMKKNILLKIVLKTIFNYCIFKDELIEEK